MKPIVKAKGLFVILLYCFMSNTVMLASGRPTPTLMLEENIYAEETPRRVVLHFFNTTQYEISFGRFYQIEVFCDGKWMDIRACKDYKSDKITLKPYQQSEEIIYIPLCQKGLYRVYKNIEYNSQTHFIAYEFRIY